MRAKMIDYLLLNANPSIQYRVKTEVLNQEDSVSEDGICMAPIAENQLKGFSTYGGQQLETDWKTLTRRYCDITFRALLIMHYSEKQS